MKNILFVASEGVPFIKTGGLADVVGSLPKCINKEYFDVTIDGIVRLSVMGIENLSNLHESIITCLLAFILHLCLELFDSYFCQFT